MIAFDSNQVSVPGLGGTRCVRNMGSSGGFQSLSADLEREVLAKPEPLWNVSMKRTLQVFLVSIARVKKEC